MRDQSENKNFGVAPDFDLFDQTGNVINFHQFRKNMTIVMIFYPKDFGFFCTKQMCSYRENIHNFDMLEIQLMGLSANGTASHARFAEKYDLRFPLLSDRDCSVASRFGCSSPWMLGQISRAVIIVNSHGLIVYRKVEPTILTWQTADKLIYELKELKNHGEL